MIPGFKTRQAVCRPLTIVAAMVAAMALSGALQAAEASATPTAQGQLSYRVATEEELDAMRGGFRLPNGLVVHFSIEKRIYQNGVETFSSFFETPRNLATLNAIAAEAGASLDPTALQTVTQNNLDNQLIETINNINIELSNLKAVKNNAQNAETFRYLLQPGLR